MSQEIQLVPQNLPLQPALSPQALGPAGLPDGTPLRKIHRMLRGRYVLATVLALIGAVAGATAGVMLPKPAWESDGVIEISPIIHTADDIDKVRPMWTQYIAGVMTKLHTESVIREAMESPEWQKVRPYAGVAPPPDQVSEFSQNLTVKPRPDSPGLIQISYLDTHKDAKDVVSVAVSSIIKGYTNVWGKYENSDIDSKIAHLQKSQQELNLKISREEKEQFDLASKDALIEEAPIVTAREQNLIALEKSLKEAKDMLQVTRSDLDAASQGRQPGQIYTPEDISRVDMRMLNKLQQRDELMVLIQTLKAQGFLDGMPNVKNLKTQLQERERQINDAAALFNRKYFIKWRTDGTGGVAVEKNLTGMKEMVARLQEEYDNEKKAIAQIGAGHKRIEDLQKLVGKQQSEVDNYQKLIDQFNFQKEMAGTFNVLSYGDIAKVSSDRRAVFGALGFLGGAAVPIAFLVLIGLANPRYRFSDETGTDMSGLTLLGILPDLPDRLSDPEQASIAAHCVHQIRTMLQISGGPEERRVFAVTSAGPGDGKTSLTLALGLSYAACGTRTLLIDCDLVGAGLTARMNVNSADGVLEAIANRSLLEYVRGTDIPDVAILPVGAAQALHASTLSPAALRRLVDEAKKHFDTILIDTGPILGSIEASLVCAAADAVVLTVARGQQRPLVEKAISHLMGIGARLAGVVFNRAQASDFDRSISGASLRSVGAGNGHNGHNEGRLGPVARAVHSSSYKSQGNEG